MRARWAAVLVAVAAAAGCHEPAPQGGEIVEYELHLTVESRGSVRVAERARVQFDGTSLPAFSLPIPDERIDGVTNLVAAIDGRPVGRAEGQLREQPGGGLIWAGPAKAATVHEFTLEYEALGALAVRGARGVFIWPAVPPGAGVAGAATVTLEWPARSVPMQGPAVGAEGWAVAVDGGVAMMTGRAVDRRVPPVVYVDLVLDDLTGAEPAWQVRELRARQLAPAFISAGLFFVVVAAGVLVMLRIRHPAARLGGAVGPLVPDELAGDVARLSTWRAKAEVLDRLVQAGLVDRERVAVARGLRQSGWIVLVVAALSALVMALAGLSLGPAAFAMPGGLAVAALLFVVRGMTFPLLTEAGAEVGMLHSRRLAQSREP